MDWFSFYTTERAQWFFVNGMMSNSLPVSCSVQQSSVLGPVLSYHTLRTSHQKCQLSYHLYTDDKEAYVSVPVSDVSVAHDLLQHCIIDTSSRCAWHWLQLNVAITELVWYGSRQILKKLSNCELTVRSDITVISPVKSVCNLGTHLDNQLKMKNLYFKWSLCASMSSTKFARCAGLLDKTLHYSLCWFPYCGDWITATCHECHCTSCYGFVTLWPHGTSIKAPALASSWTQNIVQNMSSCLPNMPTKWHLPHTYLLWHKLPMCAARMCVM